MTAYGDIDPENVAETVINRLAVSSEEISAYWMKVAGDREAYAARIRQRLTGLPIAVFIVRDISFSNPNSVAVDVMKMVEANRATSEEVLFLRSSELHCGVILLGRTPLLVSQASSPVSLPEWFPVRPGETVNIIIEDLTWTVEAALNCPEARIGEISEMLYSLEGALVDRLATAHHTDHQAGNAFMDVIRQSPAERYAELLKGFTDQHAKISAPAAFRPSLREAGSLTARIWRIVQGRSTEQLHGPSKALVAALVLDVEAGFESFVAVMTRPSNRDASGPQRFARGLLMTVASSCQFVTAAAHADAYGRFPVPLIVSFSYELRRSLAEYERVLRSLL